MTQHIHNSQIEPEAFRKWQERTAKKIKLMANEKRDHDLGRYLLKLLQDKRKPLTGEQVRYISRVIADEYPSFKERWKSVYALAQQLKEWEKELQ